MSPRTAKQTPDRIVPSPTARLLGELADLGPLVERLRAEGLQRRGLTLPRMRLLLLLDRIGSQRSTDLATRIGVTPRAITALVDGLVESGYVERRPDPTDRRAAIIDVTPLGASVGADVRASHASLAADVLRDVGVDEIEAAIGTLAAVRRAIERRLSGEEQP